MAIEYNKENISIVEIDKVRPNTWNPKDKDSEAKKYKRIKASIEKNGLRAPIVVRDNEGFEIIDGEQRWRSCKDLGYDKVLIYNEGQMTDQKAKELTIWYQQQVPFNEVDLAHLIKDLVKDEGFLLPFEQLEIDEYLKMADFNWDEFQKTGPEEVSPDELMTFSITITKEQKEIVDKAMQKCKEVSGVDISDGRILELICADYLAGK